MQIKRSVVSDTKIFTKIFWQKPSTKVWFGNIIVSTVVEGFEAQTAFTWLCWVSSIQEWVTFQSYRQTRSKQCVIPRSHCGLLHFFPLLLLVLANAARGNREKATKRCEFKRWNRIHRIWANENQEMDKVVPSLKALWPGGQSFTPFLRMNNVISEWQTRKGDMWN